MRVVVQSPCLGVQHGALADVATKLRITPSEIAAGARRGLELYVTA